MKFEGNKLHGFEPRVLVETVEAAAVEAEDILAAPAAVSKRLLLVVIVVAVVTRRRSAERAWFQQAGALLGGAGI